jgi:chromosome segregation ATPase
VDPKPNPTLCSHARQALESAQRKVDATEVEITRETANARAFGDQHFNLQSAISRANAALAEAQRVLAAHEARKIGADQALRQRLAQEEPGLQNAVHRAAADLETAESAARKASDSRDQSNARLVGLRAQKATQEGDVNKAKGEVRKQCG